MKTLSERSKESKEQKKSKGSVLVTKSAYDVQNAQFGIVMFVIRNSELYSLQSMHLLKSHRLILRGFNRNEENEQHLFAACGMKHTNRTQK